MTDLQSLAETAKAWPFEQARALLKRLRNMEKQGKPKQGPIVFETGYGPSGLPHIGTFGEVVRTTMPDLRPYFEADAAWTRHYGFKPWLTPSVSGGLS